MHMVDAEEACSHMDKQLVGSSIATWEFNNVMIFCNLYLEEIELVNKPTKRLSKEGWANVTASFQERTGKLFDREQIKNKWHKLKKDWKLWNELKHIERNLSWNPVKITIDDSHEWWTAQLKVVPHAKKFRYAGINPKLEDKLHKMFNQIVASGTDACSTLNSRVLIIESIGENEISDEADEPVDQLVTQGTTNASNANKRKRTTDSPLVELAETSCIDGHGLSKSRRVQNTLCVPTISDAIEELYKYPEILDDFGLFAYSTLYIRDDDKRELFMGIPDQTKVSWMRARYMESEYPSVELAKTSRFDWHSLLKEFKDRNSLCIPSVGDAVEVLYKFPELLDDFRLFAYCTLYIRDVYKRELLMQIPDRHKVWWMKGCYKEAGYVYSV